jgi:hypothetical protein
MPAATVTDRFHDRRLGRSFGDPGNCARQI